MTSVKRDGKTYRCFYPASNGSSSLQILECEGEVEVWDGAPADLDDDRVATAGKEHGAIFECQLTNYLRGNMIGKFTAARVWVGQGFPGEKYVTIGNTLLLEGVNLEDDEEKTPSLVFISGKSILAIKPRGAIEEYHSDNASNDFPYAVAITREHVLAIPAHRFPVAVAKRPARKTLEQIYDALWCGRGLKEKKEDARCLWHAEDNCELH